mgnify:CR=1 FL=1
MFFCIWPFLFCIRIENFEGACTGQNFLEISNGRKTVRMAPILTIFGPNESQRCQLNFEKNLGRRKNFREGEKFEKLSRKVRKILSRTRFLGRNKIETFICFTTISPNNLHAYRLKKKNMPKKNDSGDPDAILQTLGDISECIITTSL